MKIIRLTLSDGATVHVNADHVQCIYESGEKKHASSVRMSSCELAVIEDCTEIITRLAAAPEL